MNPSIRSTPAFLLSGLATLFWRWPRDAVANTWRLVKIGARLVGRGFVRCWRELNYLRVMFFSLSRNFLDAEGLLALIIAVVAFGILFLQGRPVGGHEMLDISYRLVSLLMILFGMNLLPRERERGTLELLWSQPISRGGLLLIQLLVLTAWGGLLLGLTFWFYGRFAAMEIDTHVVLGMSLSTGFTVGLLTALVSTFCRHAIATGIVTFLLVGAHYVWIPNLGPVALFMNPIPETGVPIRFMRGISIPFNRIFVFIFAAFLFDYLVRRLRRTARWFT